MVCWPKLKGWADTWKPWAAVALVGWKLDCVGTKDAAEGVKVVPLGTKSLDDALKGLLESLNVDWAGCGATVRGLEGSLHVETSVE